MFILYALARPIISSSTISNVTASASTFLSNASEACDDISDCRTISDIYKTCLAVIFISIWVSMHPDVPDVKHVGESDLGSFLDELIIMTFAIILPEIIILWVLRQRIGAGLVEEKYSKYGWTKAHAYLAIMGGLALYDQEGKFRGNLRDADAFSKEDFELAEMIERSLRRSRPASPSEDCPASNSTRIIIVTEVPSDQAEPSVKAHVFPSTGLPDLEKDSETKTSATEQKHDTASQSKGYLLPPANSPSQITVFESPLKGSEESGKPLVGAEKKSNSHDVQPKPPFLEPYSCLLEYVLAQGLVNITESEIQGNLSHGDIFAKLSALLSTGWFLMQTLARGIQGLSITELEAVTLSFTIFSIVAYALWWNKPQRVRYPVRVTWGPTRPKPAKRGPSSWKYFLYLLPRLWRELCDRIAADLDSLIDPDLPTWVPCS
ncbi:hypothetical protein V5O48_018853, partial [Marasmius crinis-equi]